MIIKNNFVFKGMSACSSSPCSNGGSCFRNGNGYVCVCTSQFTGPTCALVKNTTVPTVTVPNRM